MLKTIASGAAAALLTTPFLTMPALAHHPLGGETPGTPFEGLASGVGHPILGLDHLAFVLAAGAVAALIGRAAPLALAFAVSVVVGLAIHLNGLTLPLAEVIVAGSVVAAGALLVFKRDLGLAGWTALFGLAGVAHAYAYAEAIFGAELGVLSAYAVGLAVTQGLIVFATALGLRALGRLPALSTPLAARALGAVSAAVGLTFLIPSLG